MSGKEETNRHPESDFKEVAERANMIITKDNTFGFNTYDLEFEYKGHNIISHVTEANNDMHIITLSIGGNIYHGKENKWSGRGKRSNLYYDLLVELRPIVYGHVCDYKYKK